MWQYEVNYSVNGRRTCEIVSARSPMAAKELIRARYADCKVVFWSCNRYFG